MGAGFSRCLVAGMSAYSEAFQEREQFVGRLVAAGFGVGWSGAGQSAFLECHVGVEVGGGGAAVTWPSHSAITVVSTPACSRVIAEVWRSVWA